MPELPEVETIAADLRGLLAGAQVVEARSNWGPTLRSHEAADFAAAVAGRRIEGVGRRGKQLLVWLGSPETTTASPEIADEPMVMTIHLKMTGQLFVVAPSTPEDRHVHVVFGLADGRELRFRDIRKFGRIGLYRRDPGTGLPIPGEAEGVLAGGPEPLAADFTADRFAELLSHRRGRLKSLLLNQDFVAGVGNIYADESLWRAQLHPLRDAHTVKPAEARKLYRALREVLAEAVERRGSSVDDYTAPEGDGSMQEHLAVYQRGGEPCLRCGLPIQRIVVGGRATHFCGRCQRPPANPAPSHCQGDGNFPAPQQPRRRAFEVALDRAFRRGSCRPDGGRGSPDRETSRRACAARRRRAQCRRSAPGRRRSTRRDSPRGRRATRRRQNGCSRGTAHWGSGLMSIVRLEQVHREIGDFVILDHVDAAISAGDRIGIVGPNGAGKTTLLRLIAGIDEPDGGTVHRKRALTIAMLSQEAMSTPRSSARQVSARRSDPARRDSNSWS
jgi:formamidopyrimidine-DNA glycosylase